MANFMMLDQWLALVVASSLLVFGFVLQQPLPYPFYAAFRRPYVKLLVLGTVVATAMVSPVASVLLALMVAMHQGNIYLADTLK